MELAPEFAKRAKRRKDEREAAAAYMKETQRRTARTEELRAEILKGMADGESIYSLFLKAMEALSLATNNPLLYTQAAGDLIAIYGVGLKQPDPMKMELEAVRARLHTLEAAVEAAEDAEDRARIAAAIRAHREKITKIEADLAAHGPAPAASADRTA